MTCSFDVCNSFQFEPEVEVEPKLQVLSGERLHFRTSNMEDGVRLDMFLGRQASGGGIFDVRVLNPYTPSNRTFFLSSVYKRHGMRREESINTISTQWSTHLSLQ